jgi:thiaminase
LDEAAFRFYIRQDYLFLIDYGRLLSLGAARAPRLSWMRRFAALAKAARDEGDYQGEQFMQWFIKEQVEEVSTMSDLLKVVERAAENPLLAEEYLAREQLGGAAPDPTAPAAAGGAI